MRSWETGKLSRSRRYEPQILGKVEGSQYLSGHQSVADRSSTGYETITKHLASSATVLARGEVEADSGPPRTMPTRGAVERD